VSTRITPRPAELEGNAAWILGLRLDPENSMCDFYAVLLQRRDDRPVVSDGRIVLTTELDLVPSVLQMDDDPEMRQSILPEVSISETYVFDVPVILDLIAVGRKDETATIVDFLNILLDLTTGVAAVPPASYRRALYDMANHMTFSREFDEFLRNRHLRRTTLINAITWCLGTVLIRSRIVAR
jgi:hypothetical protein